MQSVEYITGDIISFSQKDVDELKQKAMRSPDGRYRYCFHEKGSQGMQEMVFALDRSNYLRPHKHADEPETQLILDGGMLLLLFDEEGTVRDIVEAGRGKNTLLRIDKSLYHMNLPLTEQVVIYEVRNGGFHDGTNAFPGWAPEAGKKEEAELFLENLRAQVKQFFK